MVYQLLYRNFHICSDCTKFHSELVKLMDAFKNNDYPENFFNNYFKMIHKNKNRMKQIITIPKSLWLQTRTKLRKILKDVLNFYKLQIVFKSGIKLSKVLRFKDLIIKVLKSDGVCKSQCGLCNKSCFSEYVRHFNVRIGENIRISPLAKKKVKPEVSTVRDLSLLCNHSISLWKL